MIRFIHCADLHLGRPMQTSSEMEESFIERAMNATYQSFAKIVTKAIENDVDFMLICGDIYHQKHRSVRGQWFFKKQAELLKKHNIPIYVIHGNHDPIINHDFLMQMPENVHIFPAEVKAMTHTTNHGDRAILYGFSYPESAYKDNPVPFYQKEIDEGAYHIGLLHGQENAQTGHDPYAPFKTKELEEKNFDYWALGHVHQRQVLKEQPAIVYPGNIQGCHRKETGEKGALLVELTRTKTKIEFIETAAVCWEKIRFSISELASIDQLVAKIERELSILKAEKSYIVILTLHGQGVIHEKLANIKQMEELSKLIQEELADDYLWIEQINVDTQPAFHRESWKEQDHLLGDVIRVKEQIKKEEIAANLSPLFQHRKISQYINKLNEVEVEEILGKAENIVLTALLKEVQDE